MSFIFFFVRSLKSCFDAIVKFLRQIVAKALEALGIVSEVALDNNSEAFTSQLSSTENGFKELTSWRFKLAVFLIDWQLSAQTSMEEDRSLLKLS